MNVPTNFPLQPLTGVIERSTFYNEENGYTVARFVPEGKSYTVTVIGNLIGASVGELLALRSISKYILCVIMHTMKTRITLTMDPAVFRRAKKLAHARKTSVSALIEGFVRQAPLAGEKEARPFARRWAGKFRVAADESDARLAALKTRYRLNK